MRHKTLLIYIFKIIPKGFISRIFGYITQIPFPASFVNFTIKHYCNLYNVNQNEIYYPEAGFRTFNQFFTRQLKPGIHKIDAKPDSVVSPVDARIDEFGNINQYSIIQAKGIEYSIKDLIPSEMAYEFTDGSFITLYLSPADYHRIHSPANGKIIGYFAIPGKLFTVQEFMVNGLSGLFTKNERVISYIKDNKRLLALCKIGAMNVGRITLSYTDIETNQWFRSKKEFFYSNSKKPAVKKGEEIGIFHLGSTIILLFQKNTIKFNKIKKGQTVRVGQKIASFL
ncbi:MAG: phosphatidylserine decarboxylase [Spirochaetes bacterium]|nr:phosphatidylserine decarboxylase [Spirochaetota bacterium]